MSTLRSHLSHRIALRDKRERKRSTNRAFSLTRALLHPKPEAKPSGVLGPPRASYSSDTRSSSIKGSELAFEADSPSGSLEDVLLGTNFDLSPDENNANLSSTDYEREPGIPQRQRRKHFLNARKHSHSEFNLVSHKRCYFDFSSASMHSTISLFSMACYGLKTNIGISPNQVIFLHQRLETISRKILLYLPRSNAVDIH